MNLKPAIDKLECSRCGQRKNVQLFSRTQRNHIDRGRKGCCSRCLAESSGRTYGGRTRMKQSFIKINRMADQQEKRFAVRKQLAQEEIERLAAAWRARQSG